MLLSISVAPFILVFLLGRPVSDVKYFSGPLILLFIATTLLELRRINRRERGYDDNPILDESGDFKGSNLNQTIGNPTAAVLANIDNTNRLTDGISLSHSAS